MSTNYIIREGLRGFGKARMATAGSVITISIALLLLGMMYILSTNTARLIGAIRAQVGMEAFLTEPVTQARITELSGQIRMLEGVERVQFVSKDEAAATFKKEFGEDIRTILEFNPLPPSFRIFLKEPYRTTAQADAIQKQIGGMKGIDRIIYRRDMLEFIETQARNFSLLGMGIGLFLALSSVFLVAHTIRLTIHARRKTLQAMQLVGATRWFVRAPFLLEGVLQGFAGGLAAAGILLYVVSTAAGYLSGDLREFLTVDQAFYPGLCGAGVVLGLFGSAVSVRKYIRDTIGP
ncbi:MAG TPA: permease-like cell division protein FtsX [Bacteroidota bacterium]|nr:permease-like cell division protein FtsX [Bacteroidota bacterium]